MKYLIGIIQNSLLQLSTDHRHPTRMLTICVNLLIYSTEFTTLVQSSLTLESTFIEFLQDCLWSLLNSLPTHFSSKSHSGSVLDLLITLALRLHHSLKFITNQLLLNLSHSILGINHKYIIVTVKENIRIGNIIRKHYYS